VATSVTVVGTSRAGVATSVTVVGTSRAGVAMSVGGNNPRGGGTVYQIERRVGGGGGEGGAFTFLGSTGKRSWTDETLPANSGPVTYRVTAVRSTARGVSNQFTEDFGVSSSGEMTATVAPDQGGPPRLAA
jgi:hypothetical protein